MGYIVCLLLWFSPYWWVKHLEKKINDGILVVISILIVICIMLANWIVCLSIIVNCLHFFIAYCKEFVEWNNSHSYQKSSLNYQPDLWMTPGSTTTWEQDKSMEKLIEKVMKTEKVEKLNEIYDDGCIDYKKVDEINAELDIELGCRGE